jgi:Domain of unknown function (DUF4259)
MGAWGTGILDDDTALDALDELRAAPDPHLFVRQAIDTALGADYVDYEAGHAALVSAAIIALVTKGRPLPGLEDMDESEVSVEDWIDELNQIDFGPLMAPAAQACLRVVEGPSELMELWLENDTDGNDWQEQGRELARILTRAD